MNNTCERCRFWHCGMIPEDDVDEFRYCHRHAPRPAILLSDEDNDAGNVFWPMTHRHDTCGEFVFREPEGESDE